MKFHPARHRHLRASTLLLSLWALLLLAAVVLAWSRLIDEGMEEAAFANLRLEARALAHSGVSVALHPAVTPRTPALNAQPEAGRSYATSIHGEGGRLNLAYLLFGEAPERLEVLRQYLTMRGLEIRERERFIDCLLDWVDTDNVRRLNGQETTQDYRPPNRPLTTLEELPLIAGSEALTQRHPDWRDDFTLLSQGPLDLEAAPPELIAIIPGIGQLRAERFVKARRGADGLDHTEDDMVFKSIDEVIAHLGMTRDDFAAISTLVVFHDPTVRIKSIGTAGEVHRQVEVIARKMEARNPEILLWLEK